MRWRWMLVLSSLSSATNKSSRISSIVHLPCLKLWWAIPIPVSKILNSCISLRGFRRENWWLKGNRFGKLSLIMSQWRKHGPRLK
jgi:hypothetical protein